MTLIKVNAVLWFTIFPRINVHLSNVTWMKKTSQKRLKILKYF